MAEIPSAGCPIWPVFRNLSSFVSSNQLNGMQSTVLLGYGENCSEKRTFLREQNSFNFFWTSNDIN